MSIITFQFELYKLTFKEAVGKDTDACRTLDVYIGEFVGSLTLLFIRLKLQLFVTVSMEKSTLSMKTEVVSAECDFFNIKKTVICE